MKTTLRLVIIALLLLGTLTAGAFFDPTIGRWASRDPIAEQGFTCVNGGALRATQTDVWDEEGSIPSEDQGGESLYVLVGNDAIRFFDLLGLRWKIDRKRSGKAPAEPEEGDTVADLANLIGLNATDFERWLTPTAGTMMPVTSTQPLSKCDKFEIPNTVVAYWAGNLGGSGRWWVRWNSSVKYLGSLGFKVDEYRHRAGQTNALQMLLVSGAGAKELHGLYFWGHGNPHVLASAGGDILVEYSSLSLDYKMALGLVFACDSNSGKSYLMSGNPAQIWQGFTGVLVPWPFRHYHAKHYIHHGQQETH